MRACAQHVRIGKMEMWKYEGREKRENGTMDVLLERMERADALCLRQAVVFAAVHDQLRRAPLVHEVGGIEPPGDSVREGWTARVWTGRTS